jgi:hypothetical protein
MLAILAGCGGSSSTSTPGGNTVTGTASNVAAVTVNAGPPELAQFGGALNTGFVSVDLCVPGTSTCETINYVAIDTGSSGLRILKSKLSLSLSNETDGSGNTIAECNQFVDGYTWGPVQTADLTITGTGEKASAVPIQVVDDTNSFTGAPQSCSAGSAGSDNSIEFLGAYAILGVGNFRQDCGISCTLPINSGNNIGFYYSCASTVCAQIPVSYAQQLQNPVALFPTDNNGTIVEFPTVSTQGSTLTGSLVFGIGTQSNNALGSATMLALDENGYFTTTYGVANAPYPGSFIDAGSNGLYFLDQSADGIATCSDDDSLYCPNSTLNLSATNKGFNNVSSTVKFSLGNAESMPQSSAVSTFGGIFDDPEDTFDFGLPFFYGRNVYTGMEGVSGGVPTDQGQYVAY